MLQYNPQVSCDKWQCPCTFNCSCSTLKTAKQTRHARAHLLFHGHSREQRQQQVVLPLTAKTLCPMLWNAPRRITWQECVVPVMSPVNRLPLSSPVGFHPVTAPHSHQHTTPDSSTLPNRHQKRASTPEIDISTPWHPQRPSLAPKNSALWAATPAAAAPCPKPSTAHMARHPNTHTNTPSLRNTTQPDNTSQTLCHHASSSSQHSHPCWRGWSCWQQGPKKAVPS
jgi:hypothetical protein